MFTNYLKTALRTILKHKAFSFIKIFGLALAMSAGMLIMLMFAEHRSYDRFHKNKEQIYRVLSDRDNSKFPSATTPFALAEALANYPIIRQTTRLTLGAGSEVMYGRQTFAMQAYFADPAFFKIFSFPLIQGNPDEALGAPNSIVVTTSFARKLFGEDDPLGKTLDI
ncbi:MAG TPA: ABC transporter permease, partial [Chryseosolibacter sp.]